MTALLDRDLYRWGRPPDPLAMRDPAFIAGQLPLLRALVQEYHSFEIDGLDNVPDGRALIVGNHNGGLMSPDMFALMVAHWLARGVDAPAYGLAHDVVFQMGPPGRILGRMGAVPASPENALALLEREAHVLVYPGGDLDAFRASSARGRVIFGNRKGFIRIALRAGAPIVPVVSAGAHDALHIFTEGAGLARALGLKRLFRTEVLPITLSLPLGLGIGPAFYWPLPVHMKLRVLEPIRLDYGPQAADDDEIVTRCQEHVLARMQAALDELTREGGFGRRDLASLLG